MRVDLRLGGGLAVVTFALATFAAAAQDYMPRYDVEAYCDQVASFTGNTSELIRKGCLSQEQASYDSLKSLWPSIPPNVQSYCNEVATFAGSGSYLLLKGCVQEELAAKRSNEGTHFRY